MSKVSGSALDAAVPEVIVEQAPEWVLVRIPDRDILDSPFPGIGLNFKHYGAPNGRKVCDCALSPECARTGVHKVPPDVGDEILQRLKVAQAQDVKLFSAKVNLRALAEVSGGSNPSYSGNTNEFLVERQKGTI